MRRTPNPGPFIDVLQHDSQPPPTRSECVRDGKARGWGLDTSGAEAAAGDLAEVSNFLPAHAGRGEHNALGQAITPFHLYFGATDIEHLDPDLVIWAAIIGIEDADAVGDEKSALERRAASGKNGQEMSGGNFDDEARPDERNLPGCQSRVLRCGQVETGRFLGSVRGEGNCGIESSDLQPHPGSISVAVFEPRAAIAP